jgi:hypothetical protein
MPSVNQNPPVLAKSKIPSRSVNGYQDDEWIDEEHKEYPLLLYVNETLRPDELDKLLSGKIPSLTKLKREDLR